MTAPNLLIAPTEQSPMPERPKFFKRLGGVAMEKFEADAIGSTAMAARSAGDGVTASAALVLEQVRGIHAGDTDFTKELRSKETTLAGADDARQITQWSYSIGDPNMKDSLIRKAPMQEAALPSFTVGPEGPRRHTIEPGAMIVDVHNDAGMVGTSLTIYSKRDDALASKAMQAPDFIVKTTEKGGIDLVIPGQAPEYTPTTLSYATGQHGVEKFMDSILDSFTKATEQ